MFGYWRSGGELQPRARLAPHDLLGRPAQQCQVLLQEAVVEVAHDRLDRGPARRRLDRVDVDEALALGRRLRRQPVLRQRGQHAPRQPCGVHELAIAIPGWTSTPWIVSSAAAALNVSSLKSPASSPSNVNAHSAPKPSMSNRNAPLGRSPRRA